MPLALRELSWLTVIHKSCRQASFTRLPVSFHPENDHTWRIWIPWIPDSVLSTDCETERGWQTERNSAGSRSRRSSGVSWRCRPPRGDGSETWIRALCSRKSTCVLLSLPLFSNLTFLLQPQQSRYRISEVIIVFPVKNSLSGETDSLLKWSAIRCKRTPRVRSLSG